MAKKKLYKKAQAYSLGTLPNIALVFVLAAIIFSVGQDILGNIKDNHCVGDICDGGDVNYTIAGNITQMGQDGLYEVASWLPTLGLIVAAAVVIGLVMSSFKGAV